MKELSILSVIVFFVAFAAVFAVGNLGGEKVFFNPPYYFATNDFMSVINSFLFTFFFSLLFFGYSAPIALGIEGLKFASFYSTGAMSLFDVSFALPNFLACFAAVQVGKSALGELRGKGSVFEGWGEAAKFFLAGLALMGLLLVAKRFIY